MDTPIWFVVAFQTYMDIYDTGVGQDMSCGIVQLARYVNTSQVTLQPLERLDESVRARVALVGGPVDTEVERRAEFADVINTLATESSRTTTTPAKTRERASESLSAMFHKLPVMAFKTLYCAQATVLHENVRAANLGLYALALAHLYKAACTYGLITPKWYDMDFVIAQQSSPKHPFVMKLNRNADAFAVARHYHVALGVSASSEFGNGAGSLPQSRAVLKKARRMTSTSRFIDAMAEQDEKERKFGLSSRETLEVVLQTLSQEEETTAPKTKGSTRSHCSTDCTPTQLLSTLEKHFISDEPHLNFDYPGFWRSCKTLMVVVVEAVYNTEISPGKKTTTYEVVSYLLCKAAEAVRDGQPVSATPIGRVAHAMQHFIDAEGQVLTKKAFDRSSGRIPKHRRPNLTPIVVDNPNEQRFLQRLRDRGVHYKSSVPDGGIYLPHSTLAMVEEICGVVVER